MSFVGSVNKEQANQHLPCISSSEFFDVSFNFSTLCLMISNPQG